MNENKNYETPDVEYVTATAEDIISTSLPSGSIFTFEQEIGEGSFFSKL